ACCWQCIEPLSFPFHSSSKTPEDKAGDRPMQQAHIESIKASAAYRQLVRSRRRFSFALTALMFATYYGFILFVAVAPHMLARPLYAGATTSVGIVAGVGIILIAVA